MYTSIATVMDRLEKQILRSKDKTISRKRHGGARETVEPEA
jgi:ribosome-associated translation inhibitor RaiA